MVLIQSQSHLHPNQLHSYIVTRLHSYIDTWLLKINMLNEVRLIGSGCPGKRFGMTKTWLALNKS